MFAVEQFRDLCDAIELEDDLDIPSLVAEIEDYVGCFRRDRRRCPDGTDLIENDRDSVST